MSSGRKTATTVHAQNAYLKYGVAFSTSLGATRNYDGSMRLMQLVIIIIMSC